MRPSVQALLEEINQSAGDFSARVRSFEACGDKVDMEIMVMYRQKVADACDQLCRRVTQLADKAIQDAFDTREV